VKDRGKRGAREGGVMGCEPRMIIGGLGPTEGKRADFRKSRRNVLFFLDPGMNGEEFMKGEEGHGEGEW